MTGSTKLKISTVVNSVTRPISFNCYSWRNFLVGRNLFQYQRLRVVLSRVYNCTCARWCSRAGPYSMPCAPAELGHLAGTHVVPAPTCHVPRACQAGPIGRYTPSACALGAFRARPLSGCASLTSACLPAELAHLVGGRLRTRALCSYRIGLAWWVVSGAYAMCAYRDSLTWQFMPGTYILHDCCMARTMIVLAHVLYFAIKQNQTTSCQDESLVVCSYKSSISNVLLQGFFCMICKTCLNNKLSFNQSVITI